MNLKSSLILLVLLLLSCAYKKTVNNPINAEKETIYKVITEQEIVHDTITKIKVIECQPQPINVTVYFSFDSYELSPETKRILDGIKNLVTSPLQVVGYTDTIGTEGYNHVLAMKRADTVYRYLRLSDPHTVASYGERHDIQEAIYCRKVDVCGQN
jgi:outer membrane protein OmpA-like peptidoglycan-associated protein